MTVQQEFTSGTISTEKEEEMGFKWTVVEEEEEEDGRGGEDKDEGLI